MGFGRSFKKFVKKTIGGGSSGGGMSAAQIQAQNIAAGLGRMVDGQYVAYTADDKEHNTLAEENKNSDYTDISIGSQLAKYYGGGGLLGSFLKRRAGIDERKKTLLGGFTTLGV